MACKNSVSHVNFWRVPGTITRMGGGATSRRRCPDNFVMIP